MPIADCVVKTVESPNVWDKRPFKIALSLCWKTLMPAALLSEKARSPWKSWRFAWVGWPTFMPPIWDNSTRGYGRKEPIGAWRTRPDELSALADPDLKAAAPLIDQQLRDCPFQTLVHGDAKLANFCFTANGRQVVAVDFQYTGGGVGMKDVAYFVGSCLNEDECARYERTLLQHYFTSLVQALSDLKPEHDATMVEHAWRPLFYVAWADFHRFLAGWSPDHGKINNYSKRIARQVARQLITKAT